MLNRTEGIVVRTREFGEADLIVTFLTKDFGLIHAFAKSPRKTKSRFGSSLEPLSHVRLSFWGKEDAALPRLTQSDIIRPYQRIRESYAHFMGVSEVLALVLKCCPERDVSIPMFRFLIDVLDAMPEGPPSPVFLLALKIRMLRLAGFSPKVSDCARCGSGGNIFYFLEGAVLCRSCGTNSGRAQPLSPGTIKLYDSLLHWELDKIGRIRSSDTLMKELTAIVDYHVQYYIARDTVSSQAKRAG